MDNAVLLRFDMDSLPVEEALKAGELRLYRSPDGLLSWQSRQSQQLKSSSNRNRTTSAGGETEADTTAATKEKRNNWRRKQQVLIHEIYRLLESQIVGVRDEGWMAFDVLSALLRWREQPNRNYGLWLEMKRVNEEALSDIQHFHLRPSWSRSRSRRKKMKNNSTITVYLGPAVDVFLSLQVMKTTINKNWEEETYLTAGIPRDRVRVCLRLRFIFSFVRALI